jgi:hypothetical protein
MKKYNIPKIGQKVKSNYRYSGWYGIVINHEYNKHGEIVLIIVICLDRNKKPMKNKIVKRLHHTYLEITNLVYECPHKEWLKIL